MKPYYETKLGKLYCGDSLEILPQLEVKADLCLTDPPYGIGYDQNAYKKRGHQYGNEQAKKGEYMNTNWDNFIPEKDLFVEMIKKSKNQIIFGGNYFAEYLKNSSCWLVWDKNNGNNAFADCELAWTSFKTAVRKYKFTWNGMLQEDMKNKEKRHHPTQKPIKLFERILIDYSKENDLIIDPFGGSGTTAIACENINRRWIMIEKEEAYCEIIKNRVSKIYEEKEKKRNTFKIF